jgi:hypothetical protein
MNKLVIKRSNPTDVIILNGVELVGVIRYHIRAGGPEAADEATITLKIDEEIEVFGERGNPVDFGGGADG